MIASENSCHQEKVDYCCHAEALGKPKQPGSDDVSVPPVQRLTWAALERQPSVQVLRQCTDQGPGAVSLAVSSRPNHTHSRQSLTA